MDTVIREQVPLLVRLGRGGQRQRHTAIPSYDCETETSPFDSTTVAPIAATGSILTEGDSDPTRDEAADR